MAKKSNDLAAFKAQFDPDVIIPAKIKVALEALAKDGDEAWEYELDFMKRAKVGAAQLAAFRDQFEPYIVTVRTDRRSDKRVWFASPKVAAKARGA